MLTGTADHLHSSSSSSSLQPSSRHRLINIPTITTTSVLQRGMIGLATSNVNSRTGSPSSRTPTSTGSRDAGFFLFLFKKNTIHVDGGFAFSVSAPPSPRFGALYGMFFPFFNNKYTFSDERLHGTTGNISSNHKETSSPSLNGTFTQIQRNANSTKHVSLVFFLVCCWKTQVQVCCHMFNPINKYPNPKRCAHPFWKWHLWLHQLTLKRSSLGDFFVYQFEFFCLSVFFLVCTCTFLRIEK